MGQRFLIDTNILIYYFNGTMQPDVLKNNIDGLKTHNPFQYTR